MFNSIIHWVHHLFSPHCDLCDLEKECRDCIQLRLLLEQERADKTKLLNSLLEAVHPKAVVVAEEKEPLKPINTISVPWRIRREMMEKESVKEAQILADKAHEIQQLNQHRRETDKTIEKLESMLLDIPKEATNG